MLGILWRSHLRARPTLTIYVGVYSFGDGERNRCRTAPLLFYRYLLKLSCTTSNPAIEQGGCPGGVRDSGPAVEQLPTPKVP
jgi:hypothetical protein